MADAAGCLSWERCGIHAPRHSVRVGQGEVLCPSLPRVLRHVLAFQQGLSCLEQAGRRVPANGRRIEQEAGNQGAGGALLVLGNGSSSACGLLWLLTAVFTACRKLGKCFTGAAGCWEAAEALAACGCVGRWEVCASVAAMALTSMPPCSTVSIPFPLPSLFFYLKELKPEEIFYYFSFLLSSDDAAHTVDQGSLLSCLEALQFHASPLSCRHLCSVFFSFSPVESCVNVLTTSGFPRA